jgi:hypothetical protein
VTAYPPRLRQVPDSDGFCSYLIYVGGQYVVDLAKREVTISTDRATAFLWPAASWPDSLKLVYQKHPWIGLSAIAQRARP